MLPLTLKPRPLTLHTSGYWFVAFLAVTIAAFWPSYFSKLPFRTDLYTHVHAVLMLAWCGMLIAQPFLIRANRRPWHRLLGRVSYVLVPLIFVFWILLMHQRVKAMPEEQFLREGGSFYVPLAAVILFIAAWGMAILRRHTPGLHARYMVCTALAAVDALVVRLLFFNLPQFSNLLWYNVIGFGLGDSILLVLYLVDRGPHRRAFLHMLLLFVPVHLFWFTGGQTGAWLDVVRWFRGLPLT